MFPFSIEFVNDKNMELKEWLDVAEFDSSVFKIVKSPMQEEEQMILSPSHENNLTMPIQTESTSDVFETPESNMQKASTSDVDEFFLTGAVRSFAFLST